MSFFCEKQHFMFSWESAIVNLNVLGTVEQDAFNTVPAHSELGFQNHTVKHEGLCLWLVCAGDNTFGSPVQDVWYQQVKTKFFFIRVIQSHWNAISIK